MDHEGLAHVAKIDVLGALLSQEFADRGGGYQTFQPTFLCESPLAACDGPPEKSASPKADGQEGTGP